MVDRFDTFHTSPKLFTCSLSRFKTLASLRKIKTYLLAASIEKEAIFKKPKTFKFINRIANKTLIRHTYKETQSFAKSHRDHQPVLKQMVKLDSTDSD